MLIAQRHPPPQNPQDLKICVIEEWERTDPKNCKHLVKSMPRRLEAVIDDNGKNTPY